MAEKPMSLDDNEPDNEPNTNEQLQEQEETTVVRQGEQHRPYCRKHNCLMKAYNTSGGVTRYKCQVPGCKEKEKRAQPRSVVPSLPQPCPHCAGRAAEAGEKKPKPVYCHVDFARSTQGTLLMVCPTDGCRWSVKVPRPDVAARARRMHAAETLSR